MNESYKDYTYDEPEPDPVSPKRRNADRMNSPREHMTASPKRQKEGKNVQFTWVNWFRLKRTLMLLGIIFILTLAIIVALILKEKLMPIPSDKVASLKYLQDSQKEIYTGEVVNGLPDGSGIFYGLDGYKYEGNWKNGKQHGFGKQIFAEHDTNNCSSYEGYFEIGVKSGYGTLKWKSGENYEGNWADDLKSGYGIQYYSDGEKYEGYWKNNKQHGFGKQSFAHNDEYERLSYEGFFENGVTSGNGTLKWKNGEKYEGNWKNGKEHGFGKQSFAHNDEYERLSYEGFFEIGVRSGNGTLKWEGGEKYEGAENVRSGFGIDYYSYGTKYIGNWENDKEHGDGILYASDGTVIFDGKWKNGNQLI